jgi:hypothetical protein
MKVYHRTDHANAIQQEGFRDGTGTYMTKNVYTGVWVSDVPLDANEGALGETLTEMEIPEELFEQFEWVEDGKPYREALIPAALLNEHIGSVVLHPPDQ